MAGYVTIQGIRCYGDFSEDSNVIVVGTCRCGYDYTNVWCGDGEAKTWTDAVKVLKPWADREGLTDLEFSSC